MSRFVVDSLLPAASHAVDLDLDAVAIFDGDDPEGGKYLYLSPGAFSAFLTLALANGMQPCNRPSPEGVSLLYGDEWAARKLLVG
jgi:hypothetical protein